MKILAFIGGFPESLQALLQPDCRKDFELPLFAFFISHGGIFLAAVYLAAGPVGSSLKSVWWVWFWTNGYAAVRCVNGWSGTNFGFLFPQARSSEHSGRFGALAWYNSGPPK